jgi:hypothetical protein
MATAVNLVIPGDVGFAVNLHANSVIRPEQIAAGRRCRRKPLRRGGHGKWLANSRSGEKKKSKNNG